MILVYLYTVAKSNQIEFSPPHQPCPCRQSSFWCCLINHYAPLLLASLPKKTDRSRKQPVEPLRTLAKKAPPTCQACMSNAEPPTPIAKPHRTQNAPCWPPLHFGLLGGNNDISFPKLARVMASPVSIVYSICIVYCTVTRSLAQSPPKSYSRCAKHRL